jgi:hypothetical protein
LAVRFQGLVAGSALAEKMQRPKTYTRMCLEEEHRLAKQREQPVEMESPEEQEEHHREVGGGLCLRSGNRSIRSPN